MTKNKNVSILLDTNIIIASEDNKILNEKISEFFSLCSTHSVTPFVHPASKDDINRDTDTQRKSITLSKIKRYRILNDIPFIKEELEKEYGTINKANDLTDVQLLHALTQDAVFFLITEDIGIKKRVRDNIELSKRIFNISEALEWLHQTYVPSKVIIPHINSTDCSTILYNEPILLSLQEDYPEFSEWFKKCKQDKRLCWTIKGNNNEVIALIIYKEETGASYKKDITQKAPHQIINDDDKILKICTFKVDEKAQGSKIGELLIKQILWYAQSNKFKWVYLTTYEKQSHLIHTIKKFGFSEQGENSRGEIIFLKEMLHDTNSLSTPSSLEFHKKFYPIYDDASNVRKFYVPIYGEFHAKLFPEYSPFSQPINNQSSSNSVIQETVGNTIRKVYVCNAQTKQMREGDLLLFYMLKDEKFQYSQSLTAVGVIEKVTVCETHEQLLQATAKRTVYSETELSERLENKKSRTKVKVIDFFIAGHINPVISYEILKNKELLKGHPQSISKMNEDVYKKLKETIQIKYSID